MNSLTLSWDDLRLFAAAVATGSFSKAARKLGVSQPTVGRRVEALEAVLGGPLLERTAGGCRPTALGEAIAPLADRMNAAAKGVERVALTVQRDLAGVVRIAAGELIGRYLARHSWRVTAGAPGLVLEIDARMGMANLFAGEAEIALRNIRPDSDQLYARKLWRNPFAAFGAPAYVEANPAARDERRWTACKWASFTRAQAGTPSARWLAQRVEEPEPSLRFSASSLILEAVAAGAGLAMLPTFVGEDDPRLIRLSGPFDSLAFDLWMVAHPSARRRPRVRWTMDRLAEIFSGKQAAY